MEYLFSENLHKLGFKLCIYIFYYFILLETAYTFWVFPYMKCFANKCYIQWNKYIVHKK